MSSLTQGMVAEIAARLSALGVPATAGQGADLTVAATFVDAAWSTGKKQIGFEASVLLDEAKQTVRMWQLTREVSQGFSFGAQSESSFQHGKTLYRKVKAVQYGPDGKAYEYDLDLGAITKAVEETAKRYGWRFETVLRRQQAAYPPGNTTAAAPPPPAGGFCGNCGRPVSGKFCPQCGRSAGSVQAAAPPPPPPPPPPPARGSNPSPINNILFWVAWVLLALLSGLLLVDGFSFLRLGGFALLLALPLLTKKFLFKKVVPSLVLWAGIFIACLLVFALSPTPATPPDNNNNGNQLLSVSHAVTGTISTGTPVVAATQSVPAAGGTVAVAKPGDPLDGLKLTVPAGAYSGATSFTISSAPVTGQTFGENFNPLTPLITVDNGGAYAREMMEVTIPVTIPADSFAMGFLYNAQTRQLEGMPLLAESATSITVGTRHFSSFVISAIKLALLKTEVDSGFRPGVDDFEFTNYGSYITPGGNCAGQSMAALWYYCTHPDGAGAALFGRYDNNGTTPKTPALWQDDSLAYRFVSAVMADIDQTAFNYQAQKLLRGANDTLTWQAFAYAMMLTGEPQYVGITSLSKGGGHAMIVYRIKDGNLYIADPNYPGDTARRIAYDNGKFTPYNSGANAAEIEAGKGKPYESIGYMAKATLVDWGQIARRWQEMKAKTIGSSLFPAYQLIYLDEQGKVQPFVDGMTWRSSRITLGAQFSDATPLVDVYRDGALLARGADQTIGLVPGQNTLGLYVKKNIDGAAAYVDFQYVTVTYGYLTITPPSQEGAPGQGLTYSLEVYPSLPAGYTVEWYADGALVKSGTSLSCTVSFTAPGGHTIVADLIDASDKVAMEAHATATIKVATTTTTRPATTTATTTTRTPTAPAPTADDYDYAAALAQWKADYKAEVDARRYDDGIGIYTQELEWVVAPFIKDGYVMGAHVIWQTNAFYAGENAGRTVRQTVNSFGDAQHPGAYLSLGELRAKYPQFERGARTTTRPPTTTSKPPTTTAGDTYNYQAALAQWMADEAARFAVPEVTSTYTLTTKLEWVVTPYIKDGNVVGASRVISTKTFTNGQPPVTWVSSETFDAQHPGAYMTVAQLRAKYPQFGK